MIGSIGNMFSPGLDASLSEAAPPALREALRDRVIALETDAQNLQTRIGELETLAGLNDPPPDGLGIFHGYLGVFVAAFVVTLFATPLMRAMAVRAGIIDRPSEARKVHRMPVAYLGGAAVWLGMMAGIFFSYVGPRLGLLEPHRTAHTTDWGEPFAVPIAVVLGMTVIMIIGLIDDVMKISPSVKVGGQLFAAAALALEDFGVKVAAQVLRPIGEAIGNPDLAWTLSLPFPLPLMGSELTIDLIYWTGTAVIAIFVIGACNASNLIDGLDGLLSGTTAIMAGGLLVIAMALAVADDGPRDAARVVLCLALLGGCLGFLPHNFNPASIFLGDCGSLLLGFTTIVIVLSLGDTGKTHLVLAGLIIYAIPIIDTTLAIFRRKMAGKRISDPDDQHLHHMLKRALGVKGAVLSLYGIGIAFAILGVTLSEGRGRVVYALVMVLAAFIGVTAIKIARRQQIEAAAAGLKNQNQARAAGDTPAPAEPTAPPSAPARAAPASGGPAREPLAVAPAVESQGPPV